MAKTPDDRRIYTCPTCAGSGRVLTKRAGGSSKGQEGEAYENVYCSTCDGSGQIVGEPS